MALKKCIVSLSSLTGFEIVIRWSNWEVKNLNANEYTVVDERKVC